jgi:hypothetical protein
MFDRLFGKKPQTPPPSRHGTLPSPLGLRLGAAIRLDSILSKVLGDGRFVLELPEPGTPLLVAAQGLIDLGEGVKLHRFYLDDDWWLQIKASGNVGDDGENFDEILLFGFGEVLNPSTQAQFEEMAGSIGTPEYEYAEKKFVRQWGVGSGLSATTDYSERVYPQDDGSYETRHQDMLYAREVAGTTREELLLISVETDETDSVSVVHSVGMRLERTDLEIT